jgi:Rrf2 family protein
MWISRRTDYAGRALLALTLSDSDQPMKMDELSRRTAVPVSVLEQILPIMRCAGLVRSQRGAAGGYRLNKAPEDITLERIVRLFQGPLAPISCATRKEPEDCPMLPGCSMQVMWQEVRDATIAILERTTFAQLARDASGPWTDPSLLDESDVLAPSAVSPTPAPKHG